MTEPLLESPSAYERMRREVVRLVAWLLLIAVAVIGVIGLGRWCWIQLSTDERFSVSLADVECEPPPGMTRSAFLREVEYVAVPLDLPARFPLADATAQDRLRSAFARHPWVLSVDGIETKPPANLRMRLTFRRPALAVPWQGELRVVDDRGVLLPMRTDASGLPVFAGQPSRPADAGVRWPDPEVVRQAQALRQ